MPCCNDVAIEFPVTNTQSKSKFITISTSGGAWVAGILSSLLFLEDDKYGACPVTHASGSTNSLYFNGTV